MNCKQSVCLFYKLFNPLLPIGNNPIVLCIKEKSKQFPNLFCQRLVFSKLNNSVHRLRHMIID